MKQFFRNLTIQSDFFGIRIGFLNSFISIFSITLNKFRTRYLFFFSYDPAAIRFEFLFINFTPRYERKLISFMQAQRQAKEEQYVKSFERPKIKPGGNIERALKERTKK